MHKESEVATKAREATLAVAASGKPLEPEPRKKKRKARTDGLQNDEAVVVP